MGTRLKSRNKGQIHNWSPTIYNLFLLWRAGSVLFNTIHAERTWCFRDPSPSAGTHGETWKHSGQATSTQQWLLCWGSAWRLISPCWAKRKQRLTRPSSDLRLSPPEHIHNLTVTKYKGGIHTVFPVLQLNSWKIHISPHFFKDYFQRHLPEVTGYSFKIICTCLSNSPIFIKD